MPVTLLVEVQLLQTLPMPVALTLRLPGRVAFVPGRSSLSPRGEDIFLLDGGDTVVATAFAWNPDPIVLVETHDCNLAPFDLLDFDNQRVPLRKRLPKASFFLPSHEELAVTVLPVDEGIEEEGDPYGPPSEALRASAERLTLRDLPEVLLEPPGALLGLASDPRLPAPLLEALALFRWAPLIDTIAANPNCPMGLLIRLSSLAPTQVLANAALPLFLLKDPGLRDDLSPLVQTGLETH